MDDNPYVDIVSDHLKNVVLRKRKHMTKVTKTYKYQEYN